MGQVKVGECYIADVIVISYFHFVLVFLRGGFAGFRVGMGTGSRPCFRPVAGFHLHRLGERILPVKE